MKNIAYLLTCLQLAGATAALLYPCSATAVEIPMMKGKMPDIDEKSSPLVSISFKPTATSMSQPLYVRTDYDDSSEKLLLLEYWTIDKHGKKHVFRTNEEGPTPEGLQSITLNDFNLDGVIDLRIRIGWRGQDGIAYGYQFFTWKKDRFVLCNEADSIPKYSEPGRDTVESYWSTGWNMLSSLKCESEMNHVFNLNYTKYRIKNCKFVPLVSVKTVNRVDLKPYEAKKYPKSAFYYPNIVQYIYQDGKLVRQRLYDTYYIYKGL